MSNDKLITPFEPHIEFLSESASFASSMVFLLESEQHALESPNSDLAVTYKELARSVHKSYQSPRIYLVSRLFISYVAAFEVFLQDMAHVVIRKHPKKVGQVSFSLSDILDATDQQELVRQAAERTLNDLAYKKPKDYLSKFCDLLSISMTSFEQDWDVFIEAKARRDLGVHNNWRCNATYLRKMCEAGVQTNLTEGQSAVPADDDYLHSVDDSISKLTKAITEQVCSKHWPEFSSPYS